MKLKNKNRKYIPKRGDVDLLIVNMIDIRSYGLQCVMAGMNLIKSGVTMLPSNISDGIFMEKLRDLGLKSKI